MVARKSKVRERWRLILEEADRIPEKYLLTLDPALTDDTLTKMIGSWLRVFLPEQVIRTHYVGRKIEGNLATVARLVETLQRT